ncbi:EAL domain-containing protein [Brevundimonas sp.]|uniref:EAL domain-containing protein n=1 Tax=Brevundimonas sp. TaxID=1871086 RepID=UPI002ED7B8DB
MLSALAATAIVTATLLGWTDARRQTAAETERLTRTAMVIGSLAAESVRAEDRTGTFAALRAISQMPDVTYGRIQMRDGRLLAETGGGVRLASDVSVGTGDGASVWSVLNTGTIEVQAPVVSQGERVGEITLLARAPGVRERVLGSIIITILGVGVAALAGLLIALRLGRRISAPIVRLAAFANEVRDTQDYSADPEVVADGEVGDLADGVRSMLHGLRERDRRIAEHVASLESTVAERTAQLSEAKVAAEAANAAKSDFLAVMSHEIRTPLNGILALSDLLNRADLPEKPRRYAEVIANSGKSLICIINDILDFSKVEAGKLDLESVEVDPAVIAADVASLFAGRAAEKGLDLAVYVHPAVGPVAADPTRLRQVISNLVNNAIKFTGSGGVTIRIEPATDGSPRIELTVIDTGPGIPADKLPGLFEAFSQADQSTTRKHGGTGLGLAICDRLVRAMGGEWVLSSREGEGSCFGFRATLPPAGAASPLPVFAEGWSISLEGSAASTLAVIGLYAADAGIAVVAPDLASARIVADIAGGVRVTPTGNPGRAWSLTGPFRGDDLLQGLHRMSLGLDACPAGRRGVASQGRRFPGASVLVVDDSEVNCEVAAEALGQFGVDVAFAGDGLAAVERLRTDRFDLVLMDGSMPRLDGFEACALIRREEAETGRPRAAILALTAHVIGTAADAWREAGMDGVIHKPFTLDDIEAALARHCGGFAVAAAPPSEAAAETGSADDGLFDPAIRADLDRMAASGREDFVLRVQSLYADNAPLRLDELRAAEAAGEMDAAARAAHALKSMSLSLGARAVAEAASSVETAARAGECRAGAADGLADLVSRTLAAMGMPDAAPAPGSAPSIVDAIRAGELDVAFQPLMNRSGGFAGKAEALVRWTTASGDVLSPTDFVPRLEHDGSIRHLTDFVLGRALTLVMTRPGLKVSVNASATEFQQPDFASRIETALARAGCPGERLEIEVTETAILDIAAARPALERLAGLGVGVALDDFGSGYTSLHALRELRFTTLKIDRSFVERCLDDTASAAIIHAVISVGRSLGMQVVCEGVETEAQVQFLRTAGVHLIQGFVYGRPAPFEALPADEAVAA